MCDLYVQFFFFFLPWVVIECRVQRLYRGLGYAWKMRYFQHEAADENNESVSCMISYLEQRQKQNANICKLVVLKHKCFVLCSSYVNAIGNVGKPVNVLTLHFERNCDHYQDETLLWSCWMSLLLTLFPPNFWPTRQDTLTWQEVIQCRLDTTFTTFLARGLCEECQILKCLYDKLRNAEFSLPSCTCALASCKFSSKGFALHSNYTHMTIAFH